MDPRCPLPRRSRRRQRQRAVGWLIPQPQVIDEKGDTARLDDVIGGRWTVLHTGPGIGLLGLAKRRRPRPESHTAA